MEGVGRELGGMTLGGDQATQELFGVVDRHHGRLKNGGAFDGFGEGRGGGPGGTASLGVEGDRGDAATAHSQGESGDVTAGSASGGAGEGVVGRLAAMRLIAKEVVEELPIHWVKGTE
jgi:hypothetical protein